MILETHFGSVTCITFPLFGRVNYKAVTSVCSRNKRHLGLLNMQQLHSIPVHCILCKMDENPALVSQSFYFITYVYTVSWVEMHVRIVIQLN